MKGNPFARKVVGSKPVVKKKFFERWREQRASVYRGKPIVNTWMNWSSGRRRAVRNYVNDLATRVYDRKEAKYRSGEAALLGLEPIPRGGGYVERELNAIADMRARNGYLLNRRWKTINRPPVHHGF